MKKVIVKKDALLEALKANLKVHIDDVAISLEDRRELIRHKMKAEAEFIEEENGYQPDVNFHFPMPEDHIEDYEKVITMVEMSVDEEIELDSKEFDCYVMDNWSWKSQLVRTMLNYK